MEGGYTHLDLFNELLYKLSKEEAINEHRKMWNWIAEETIKRKTIVTKDDYMHEAFKKEHPYRSTPQSLCFCCEYTRQQNESCSKCPIEWPSYEDRCNVNNSPFYEWDSIVTSIQMRGVVTQNELKVLSSLAKDIANLPEKEDY